MKRTSRLLLCTFVLLLILVGLPVWLVQRQMRQERLDAALLAAVETGEYEQVLHSLRQGANPNADHEANPPGNQGFWKTLLTLFLPQQVSSASALQRAYKERLVEIQRVSGPSLSLYMPLSHRRPTRWDNVIKALLDFRADANGTFSDKIPLLTVAVAVEDGWMIRQLLQHGASVSLDNIVSAMRSGYPRDILKLLLAHWENINETDSDGKTALQIAISEYVSEEKRLMPMVKLLVAHKIDVQLPDKYGNTPLRMAQTYKLTKVAQALIEAGATR